MATATVKPRSDPRPLTALVLAWSILIAAMLLPTAMQWGHFVALSAGGQPSRWVQAAYAASKVVLLLLPLLAVRLLDGSWPRPAGPTTQGMLPALAFALIVAAGIFGLYFALLRDASLFSGTSERLRHKLTEFGLTTPLRFAAFAAFVSLAHALLEEYYWRWFVFGGLRRLLPLAPALLLSGLAFLGNHVVILGVFFPDRFLTAALPLSLGVGVGGVVWAWIYDRYGSLYACWLSHAVIDVALFVVGYDLLFRR